MALAKPSPLATSISGNIGPAQFRMQGGRLVLAMTSTALSRHSPNRRKIHQAKEYWVRKTRLGGIPNRGMWERDWLIWRERIRKIIRERGHRIGRDKWDCTPTISWISVWNLFMTYVINRFVCDLKDNDEAPREDWLPAINNIATFQDMTHLHLNFPYAPIDEHQTMIVSVSRPLRYTNDRKHISIEKRYTIPGPMTAPLLVNLTQPYHPGSYVLLCCTKHMTEFVDQEHNWWPAGSRWAFYVWPSL